MLEVEIDNILPVTEARDSFNKIVDEVEGTDQMYVLTKNGKPAAVVVGVNHLEKLTGKSPDQLTSAVEKKADETPVVEEVKVNTPTPEAPLPPQTETPVADQPTAPAKDQLVSNAAGPQLTTPPETPNEEESNKNDDLFV